MRGRIETLARIIVRNVYAQTGGGPIPWRVLHQICAGLCADGEDSIEAALLLAIESRWLEQQDGQTVELTDEGRRLAIGGDC
jgi:hypothetical protein